MARPIRAGTISFGLVSVPVRMYSATCSQAVRFPFLDRRDMQPIGYDKVNRETGEPLPPGEIVRGFEFEQGRFVEVTHAIDICAFVSLDEIDPLHFRKGYYLLPRGGAEKPYRLLVEALGETGRVAIAKVVIAKVVIRNKQHLSCIRAVEDVRKAEVETAKTLIENLAASRDPERSAGEVVDLMEALRESVEATKKQTTKRKAPAKRKAS